MRYLEEFSPICLVIAKLNLHRLKSTSQKYFLLTLDHMEKGKKRKGKKGTAHK